MHIFPLWNFSHVAWHTLSNRCTQLIWFTTVKKSSNLFHVLWEEEARGRPYEFLGLFPLTSSSFPMLPYTFHLYTWPNGNFPVQLHNHFGHHRWLWHTTLAVLRWLQVPFKMIPSQLRKCSRKSCTQNTSRLQWHAKQTAKPFVQLLGV